LLADVSGTDALLALVALAAGTVDAIGGGGGPPHRCPRFSQRGCRPTWPWGRTRDSRCSGRRRPWCASLARGSCRFDGRGGLFRSHSSVRWPAQLLLWVRPRSCARGAGALSWPRGGSPPSPAGTGRAGAERGRGFRRRRSPLGVGAYDGFFGPGTGRSHRRARRLLQLPLQHALRRGQGDQLRQQPGGALLFAARGTVVWHTALPMAAGPARRRMARCAPDGSRRRAVVRWVLLCVVAALVLKLSFDALRG
jgi:hypothetical protein